MDCGERLPHEGEELSEKCESSTRGWNEISLFTLLPTRALLLFFFRK